VAVAPNGRDRIGGREEAFVELSARNQLQGKVTAVKRGAVEGEVAIALGGGQTIIATISLVSVDRLKLKEGDAVTAVIKATDVMVGK
jgi:molybdate transport system regulatory protein